MPLAMVAEGEKARVRAISGTDAVKKHLGSLGLVPGSVLRVVQISAGSMIVGLHDSRLALNEDLVKRVMVEVC